MQHSTRGLHSRGRAAAFGPDQQPLHWVVKQQVQAGEGLTAVQNRIRGFAATL